MALNSLRRFGSPLAVALELKAEQGADDRAQLFALVVEGEEVTRLGIFAYEQKVEDADGLVAFELGELVHDPTLEVRLRSKADREQLNRAYLLRHGSPPLSSVIILVLTPKSIGGSDPAGHAASSQRPGGTPGLLHRGRNACSSSSPSCTTP